MIGGTGITLGAVLPWATVGPFSIDGTAGDGKLTLVGGLAIILLGFVLRSNDDSASYGLIALVLGLGVLAAGVYDTVSVDSHSNSLFNASVGIGLWLTDVAALVAVVGALLASRRSI